MKTYRVGYMQPNPGPWANYDPVKWFDDLESALSYQREHPELDIWVKSGNQPYKKLKV